MGKVIGGIAAIEVIAGIITGIYFGFLDSGSNIGIALLIWISSIVSGILLYAFAIMYETIEQNNTFLRELLRRIPAPEKQQVSLGNSKASLDKLKDYKMS